MKHSITIITCLCALGGLASAQTFTIELEGSQEVPPIVTTGTGTCTVTLDAMTGSVSVNGTYSTLSTAATAAHIHGPAAPGATAGVVLGLSVTGGTDGSVFGGGTLTPSEVADLLAGLYYVNVHSMMWSNGEVRGQIVAPAETTAYGGNPPGSLIVLGGAPAVGGSMVFGVENPLGTQPAGSLPFLAFATQVDPSYDATGTGLMLPGWGMTGGPGELLIGVGGPNPITTLGGSAWAGLGNPAPIPVSLPPAVQLIGVHVFAQGLMINTMGPGPLFGLTNGLDLLIGQ